MSRQSHNFIFETESHDLKINVVFDLIPSSYGEDADGNRGRMEYDVNIVNCEIEEVIDATGENALFILTNEITKDIEAQALEEVLSI